MKTIIDRLALRHDLDDEALTELLTKANADDRADLFAKARQCREEIYGRDVYIRGLIEVTNYCKNNCNYCGIRRDNRRIDRYRLTAEEILGCCDTGYELGFRTFVLQGGEDRRFSDAFLIPLIREIKNRYPEAAVTLSLGERREESYRQLFEAGADRYLLRHETASRDHYGLLHPKEMSWEHRLHCLEVLKAIGYETGCGMMIGSPGQSVEHLIEDLRFLQRFRPQMVGIGPFLPQRDTPFGREPGGSSELTLVLLAVIRLLLPHVLLPATTALGTAAADGREQGILSGANVVMPNLSPPSAREKYLLYDHKLNSGKEAAEGLEQLKQSMEKIGYHVVVDRGNCK